jgi:hypothetical protein
MMVSVVYALLGTVKADRIGRDRIQLLLRNARQMKKIVEATYPNLDFGDEVRDTEKECSSPKVRSLYWKVSNTLTNRSPMVRTWLASGRG